MYYSGGKGNEPNSIGYAISEDGINWIKNKAPIFVPDKSSDWDGEKVTACQVFQKDNWYWMFYIGFNRCLQAQIGIARSKDGVSNWKRYENNPILSPTIGSWDADGVYKPFVLLTSSKCYLWYNGRRGAMEQIGLAYHSLNYWKDYKNGNN
jgi:predicted GH43/DUF377 family glycosyl hydrolase